MAEEDLQKTQRETNVEPIPAPPSLSALKKILRDAADTGRLTWSKGFKRQCLMRGDSLGFNTVDAAWVIRSGVIVKAPAYDAGRAAWRCEVADALEGRNFVVDVALDCKEDFSKSPRVEVVSAYWRTGPRKEVADWSDR